MKKNNTSLKNNTFVIIAIVGAFVIATTLSFVLVYGNVQQLRNIAEQRLTINATTITASSLNEYNNAVTTLNSLRALFSTTPNVTRDQFYKFIDKSEFFYYHKGFSSLVYIERVFDKEKENFIKTVQSDTSVSADGYPDFKITPDSKNEEYWPIVYASPESNVGFLLGQDQKEEAIRSENIGRARDLGNESLSLALQLGQGGIGALIAVPMYKTEETPETIEGRREAFYGAVTSAFLLEDFFRPILPVNEIGQKRISIMATGRSGNSIPLFTSEYEEDFLTRLFGTIEVSKTAKLGENSVTFIFSAPVRYQLSPNEIFEPLLLTLVFFVAAIFMSIIIVVTQKLKNSVELKKRYEFLATLAHQLGTPLGYLRWQILGKGLSKKEGQDKEVVKKAVSGLSSVIQRILLYIDISGNKKEEGKNEAVSLEKLYEKTLEAVSESHDISRIERVGEKLSSKNILANEENIILAFLYIIENALVYSPKESKVTIELKSDNTTNVEIVITDNGYGIPKDEQKKVFSEFFRASNASLGINYGSGVSLFMAKSIIENHNGNIQFKSEKDKGSTFTVTLPLLN